MSQHDQPTSQPRWSRRALITALVLAAGCLVLGLVLSQLATFGSPPPRPSGWFRPTWDDVTTYEMMRAAGVVLTWVLFPAFLVTAVVLAAIEAIRSR